jgi:endo-1,4-beta-D-glucanase Y
MPSLFREAAPLCIALCMVLVLVPACAKSPAMGDDGGAAGGISGATTGGISGGRSGGAGGTAAGAGGGTRGGIAGSDGAATTIMKPPSAYPQNTMPSAHPFPQGHPFAQCPLPIYDTDTVAAAYNNWKARFYQGGRVIRPDVNDDTVSEGIAYGMLIGVYMNDRPMFDTLWGYAQMHMDGNGLMNWNLGAGGNVIGGGSATDADEDMAWALLMAGAQWGGSYNAAGITLVNNIWNHEVEAGSNILKPGDNFGGSNQTNPSYFAPSYYRVFARVTSNNWMAVVESSYAILALASGSSGLVPNWANSSGAGVNGPGNDVNGPYFGYDACRTPWRIALDFCDNGESRAKAYLDRIVGFYASKAPVALGTIRDGYTSTGLRPPAPSTIGGNAAGISFFGPGAVAAMSGGPGAFLTLATEALDSNTTDPAKMNIPGVFTYYHASWGVLSLLTISGNFWNMLR